MDKEKAHTRFENNKSMRQLEMHLNGHMAFIEYIVDDNKRILIHSYIPEALYFHNNLGYKFISAVRHYAMLNNLHLESRCPYLKALLSNS